MDIFFWVVLHLALVPWVVFCFGFLCGKTYPARLAWGKQYVLLEYEFDTPHVFAYLPLSFAWPGGGNPRCT